MTAETKSQIQVWENEEAAFRALKAKHRRQDRILWLSLALAFIAIGIFVNWAVAIAAAVILIGFGTVAGAVQQALDS